MNYVNVGTNGKGAGAANGSANGTASHPQVTTYPRPAALPELDLRSRFGRFGDLVKGVVARLIRFFIEYQQTINQRFDALIQQMFLRVETLERDVDQQQITLRGFEFERTHFAGLAARIEGLAAELTATHERAVSEQNAAFDARVAELTRRLDEMEARAASASADDGASAAAAAGAAAAAAEGVRGLDERIGAVEGTARKGLETIDARVAALEQRAFTAIAASSPHLELDHDGTLRSLTDHVLALDERLATFEQRAAAESRITARLNHAHTLLQETVRGLEERVWTESPVPVRSDAHADAAPPAALAAALAAGQDAARGLVEHAVRELRAELQGRDGVPELERRLTEREAKLREQMRALRGQIDGLGRRLGRDLSALESGVGELRAHAEAAAAAAADARGAHDEQAKALAAQSRALAALEARTAAAVREVAERAAAAQMRLERAELRTRDMVDDVRLEVWELGEELERKLSAAGRRFDELSSGTASLEDELQALARLDTHASTRLAELAERLEGVEAAETDLRERVETEVTAERGERASAAHRLEELDRELRTLMAEHQQRTAEALAQVRQSEIDPSLLATHRDALAVTANAFGARIELLQQSLDQLAVELRAKVAALPENAASEETVRAIVAQSTNDLTARVEDEAAQMHAVVARLNAVPYRSGPIYLPGMAAQRHERFDYVGFENVFRGPESMIAERQRVYRPFFSPGTRILDIGCGRGEFLDVMRDSGVAVFGLDINETMVAHCRAKGLHDVVHADALEYLRDVPSDSIDGAFTAQVVEHFAFDVLYEFLKLLQRSLKPGASLIAETVNPNSIEGWKTFFVDPTHVRPLFPDTLQFMFRSAGFSDARVFYPNGAGFEEREPWLQGEYAIVGTK